MNFNDMKKDAESRSQFVKLQKDVPTRIRFLSEDFKKVESSINDKKVIRYEVPCVIDGVRKNYQGSARFYEACMLKAVNRNKRFTELVYIVTKKGDGMQTTYDIDVMDGASPAQEMPVDGVPF